ncbi:glycoside hydrolase family 88/105 protein [Reichenbachiella ulvae]|uniref:Glycoside hydrolase family 88 protein n=1 Tax=Reichenbachiella ulvae TaxID=2980104 RepID=A0ABT3D098_9BACT|nr:glycoside hydrolase family 88 protein [Reichenbachiella ulvae]MCV9389373.1 glycoside hydrolase family 88 protein [Reichenbachiella ulvae]
MASCSTNKEESNYSITKTNVLNSIKQVNNKWQQDHRIEPWAFWHPATYHIGNLAAYEVTGNDDHLKYTQQWAEANEWMGAKSDNPEEWKFSHGESDEYVLFGDWQACFQVYIDLNTIDPAPHKVARAREVMQYQINTDESKYWWWIDGLFMVMPVMPRMYELTGDSTYLNKLHEYYSYTKSLTYDEEDGLWYRDKKYIYPGHKTNNGKKDFWSRGNGWVIAAHARTLDKLPKSDPHYDEYTEVFTQMAKALKASQQEEGYWTRSLLDEQQAIGPETSGTAFFTYGMLWGINQGILDKGSYGPVVEKAWEYLATTAIQSDGTLGYVQPIGERAVPGQIVDQRSTSDFGVGAFLLAASEMITYLENK